MIAVRRSRDCSDNHEDGMALELAESEVSHTFLRNFDTSFEQCFVVVIES